jgi:hypothetical protein
MTVLYGQSRGTIVPSGRKSALQRVGPWMLVLGALSFPDSDARGIRAFGGWDTPLKSGKFTALG